MAGHKLASTLTTALLPALANALRLAPQMDRMQEKQLKAQRELFVGNLAPGAVSEASLYQVFHSALIAAFPQAAQPGQEPVMKVRVQP
jgi:hypothetical protein